MKLLAPRLRIILFQVGLVALLAAVGLLSISSSVQAAVTPRSLLISNNLPSAAATYTLSFTLDNPETLGSIKLLFCANDPLIGDPCTVPSGFDISAATLTSQSGETGFSIYAPGTNANTMVLSRLPAATAGGPVSYTFTNVVNPNSDGSFYARLQTFATTDASGAENEHGGLALSLNEAIQVSTTVPPYLLFCSGVAITAFDCTTASGSYINFGNLNTSGTASATSQMVTATNAANGFNITVSGQTMTSGNNVINALTVADVSRPGIGQFGLNLVANTAPLVGSGPQGPGTAAPTSGYNQANFFKFNSDDTIVSHLGVDDYRKFTVSYILNIPVGQPVGVYATTLTYVCLANF